MYWAVVWFVMMVCLTRKKRVNGAEAPNVLVSFTQNVDIGKQRTHSYIYSFKKPLQGLTAAYKLFSLGGNSEVENALCNMSVQCTCELPPYFSAPLFLISKPFSYIRLFQRFKIMYL